MICTFCIILVILVTSNSVHIDVDRTGSVLNVYLLAKMFIYHLTDTVPVTDFVVTTLPKSGMTTGSVL